MIAAALGPNRALWLDQFHAFSALHLLTLLALGAIIAGVVTAGVWVRGTPREAALENSLAGVGALAWIVVSVWWLSPARFTWGNSLPLQLCDIAGLLAPVAIASRNRTARSLLYFWGIGLCTQGLLTPVAREGPAHVGFWMTWVNHGAIALLAAYDLLVRRFRPTWRDLCRTLVITTAYALCMFGLDAALGWNYGYLGPTTPGAATILDALGPWPARAPIIMLLGAGVMTALMVPWSVYSWMHDRRPNSRREANGD